MASPPATTLEATQMTPTSQDRQRTLVDILVPDADRLAAIQLEFDTQLNASLRSGSTTNATFQKVPDIRPLDTPVMRLPTRQEAGDFFVLSVEESGVRAARVTLVPSSVTSGDVVAANDIVIASDTFQPYLATDLDDVKLTRKITQLTASVFAMTVVEAVAVLLEKEKIIEPVQFVLVSSRFLDQQDSRAEFFRFEEYSPEQVLDPLSGIDLKYLCNMHLARKQLKATVTTALSHTAALILAASYMTPRNTPRCLVAMDVGSTVSVSYVQRNARELGFQGEILDVDIAHFNGNHVNEANFCVCYGLPYSIPDFELDTSPKNSKEPARSFENMTAATYLPELCRRLVLRAFQAEAPASVWVPQSLSYCACAAILADSPKLETTTQVVRDAWDWNASADIAAVAAVVKSLVVAVFNRSAALVAATMACMAKRTGRLQPALGGVTVALSGVLATNKYYQNMLRLHLDGLFHRDTSNLILFYAAPDGAIKGAALHHRRPAPLAV